MKRIFIFIFFVLSFVFILHYLFVGQAVYGDGRFYYSITRSIYKDYDINFLNEARHHWSPKNNNSIVYDSYEISEEQTPTGLTPNKYSIGAPLLWLPSFTIADIFTYFFGHVQNGYSNIYQIIIGLTNISFITVGLVILYKFLIILFPRKISLLSALLIVFGSNVFYYGSVDVINSHPASFLFGSIFLYYWYKTLFEISIKRWLILGAIVGILGLIRTQDLIFLLIPISEAFLLVRKNPNLTKHLGLGLFSLFIGAFITFSPQMIVWKILYGSYFISPYISGGEGFNFLNPQVFGVLFSTKVGVLWWTPIFTFSILGLFLLLKNRKLKLISWFSLLITFSSLYIISSWSTWSQGESFGIRMLISIAPFFAIGLAEILRLTIKKYGARVAITISVVLVFLNFSLIFYFLTFSQNPTFDREVMTQQRSIEKLFHLENFKLFKIISF